MSPVIHRGDEGGGVFESHPTAARFTKKRQPSRLAKAEQAVVKRKILAKFNEGERVADPTTGAIAVVDASMPTGLRPLWKASNAHNHGTMLRLGVTPVSKSKAYDGPAYGHLAGSEDEIAKRRGDRQANPNSRL